MRLPSQTYLPRPPFKNEYQQLISFLTQKKIELENEFQNKKTTAEPNLKLKINVHNRMCFDMAKQLHPNIKHQFLVQHVLVTSFENQSDGARGGT